MCDAIKKNGSNEAWKKNEGGQLEVEKKSIGARTRRRRCKRRGRREDKPGPAQSTNPCV
eukprot:NODE_2579_length_769_cov_25.002778_g1804_i0.p6 GENE.NODE_2579_length_769_cov_25.002778_g1804_i0~~NODE_2579_length_769_cov_25.002778_g1804_i0.p6  ORF type:complete len:59 (+),score=8.75 NODE_2579_length_769_cov_25.002778_g1804_i0:487-663(+)